LSVPQWRYWKGEAQIDGLIQEALDAIEYALGDTTTIYGKKRAANAMYSLSR
jgi:hypothetical protein